MSYSKVYFVNLLLFLLLITKVSAENLPSISEKTKGMEKHIGLFDFYWDEPTGNVWLEVDKMNEDFIYVVSLPRGIGSNDIGLDRGQLNSTKVVHFEKHGPKIFLVQNNLDYRAITNNESEKRAVEESFAKSILFGFTVEAADENKFLVDATSFFLRDGHDVIGRLRATEQGNYSLDLSRSSIYKENTKSFPRNTEFEVILTFAGEKPGRYLNQVVPTPEAVTVHERYSFVQLPDDDFESRKYDPRAGYFGISFKDYAAPLDESLTKRFISKHRLKKKNPNAEMSEPVEPIVYYVDSGAPEPVKSALIEGASWWNEAFESAGYINAFQVKELPENADPMDVRYNVIQWVHRSTRGWSYGGGVIDPRTGEIIKGHVTLGSLRIRQDYMIAEGLLAPYKNENSASNVMTEMALARIRQLSAHEVGHTLGLAHNFAASTYGRASVMDYPHPYIKLDDRGVIDLSEAYDNGIGEWDKFAIRYGYQVYSDPIDEEKKLKALIANSVANEMLYISDKDSRPEGGLHPYAHLWDNGENAIDELDRIMEVRRSALNNFSDDVIKFGEPSATIENVLVPVYLLHRYQVEAAVKVLGGSNYAYKVKGDNQIGIEIIESNEQIRALVSLLQTVDPNNLKLPRHVLEIIPPLPPGYNRTNENFKTYTGLSFDPIVAAETAADNTLKLLFNPQRCARLVEHHAIDKSYPSLNFVLNKITGATIKRSFGDDYSNEVNIAISNLVLNYLFKLASSKAIHVSVNAAAFAEIEDLKKWFESELDNIDNEKLKISHTFFLNQIKMFKKNPEKYKFDEVPEMPAGSPIGLTECMTF